jgi:thymidylate synthase (FAD)
MASDVENLRWIKFPVLNDGFVCLVDIMGDDSSIVQAARVSYGAGTKKVSDDRGLIRYLMAHRHSTPFEMVELKFLVRVPMDTWRQWVRHRTANINEYSTRYSEAIDSQQITSKEEWRLQSSSNKQGSSGFVTEWPDCLSEEEKASLTRDYGTPGNYLSVIEASYINGAREIYNERLKYEVAREQARKDLPLSTYTEAYWKIDLHNLLHFLALRMDSHAQLEIRQYANAIGNIVEKLLPLTWEAFKDYRLNSMSLSATELEVIRDIINMNVMKKFDNERLEEVQGIVIGSTKLSKREKEGILHKLQSLGVLTGESL